MEQKAQPRAATTTRAGLVLGWGVPETLVLGYARTRDRPGLLVPDRASALEVLSAGRHRSVFLLAPERDLDFPTVGRLIEQGRAARLPIGLLPLPDDPDEAGRAVRRAERQAAGAGRAYRHRTALYCDFRPEPPSPDPSAHGSGQADAFMARLTDGVEGLVLHSHGNGADFRVGNHVLCLRVGPKAPAPGEPGERFLPCQAGGVCRLDHKTGFVAYHGADAVRARLVVMLSCSAYQPHGGLLGARFQLSQNLMRGEDVAAVVASVRINHGTPQLGVAVDRLLREGASVGEVALRINRLAPADAASYVCLGDPDLTLSRLPTTTPGAATAATPAAPATASAGPYTAPGRDPAAPAARRRSGPTPQGPVDLLFAADLAASQGAVTTAAALAAAATDAIRGPATPRFDRHVARMLARAVDDGDRPAWHPLCTSTGEGAGPPCPLCGGPTVEEEHASRLYAGYLRRLTLCPTHAVVRDVPAGTASPAGPVPRDIRIDRVTRTVRWNGDGVPGVCAVAAPGAAARTGWARAEDGRCAAPAGDGDVPVLIHVAAGSFAVHRPTPTGAGGGHA
ncbi:hypothetical protein ACWDE9_20565 [Streptomyces olivaceoviridis]